MRARQQGSRLERINEKLSSLQDAPRRAWSRPVVFDLSVANEQKQLEDIIDSGEVLHVIDEVERIAQDLFKARHPESAQDKKSAEEFSRLVLGQGPEFGRWIYFPWSRSLERYPSQEDHFFLRTTRNQELITRDEQRHLGGAAIAAFGLSVGSAIVEQLAQSGIGRKFILGDFDIISPSNLNRMRADMGDVGDRKVDFVAKKISRIDPYAEQVHFHEGYSSSINAELGRLSIDLVFEEMDDVSAKASLRNFASSNFLPLIMAGDIGDKSVIDIERHDSKKIRPFNGRISEEDYQGLLNDSLSSGRKRQLLAQIAGVRHLTPRLLKSVMEVGSTTSGIAQLGTTTNAGASLSVIAAREILLGRRMSTGTSVSSPKKILKMQSPDPLKTDLQTLVNFTKFYREQQAEK